LWYRPAQAGVADYHPADSLPGNVRGDTTTGCFNFG